MSPFPPSQQSCSHSSCFSHFFSLAARQLPLFHGSHSQPYTRTVRPQCLPYCCLVQGEETLAEFDYGWPCLGQMSSCGLSGIAYVGRLL